MAVIINDVEVKVDPPAAEPIPAGGRDQDRSGSRTRPDDWSLLATAERAHRRAERLRAH